MNLFTVCFIFVCITISPHWTLENRFMGNKGVFMEDLGHVVPSDNFWYHSFVIDIPTKVSAVVCLGGNPQVNRICQENRIHPLGLVLSILEKDMQHEVNMLSNFIALNTVSFKGPGRRQRSAPLSFIGGLSRTLFGTATGEDLQIVANRVNDLIRRNRNITGAILSHAKNFKSYIRILNVRFQNMCNMIDGVITNMKGLEDRSNAIVDEIKALTFLAANVTDSFKYNINEIRDAIINLQKVSYTR